MCTTIINTDTIGVYKYKKTTLNNTYKVYFVISSYKISNRLDCRPLFSGTQHLRACFNEAGILSSGITNSSGHSKLIPQSTNDDDEDRVDGKDWCRCSAVIDMDVPGSKAAEAHGISSFLQDELGSLGCDMSEQLADVACALSAVTDDALQ